MNVSRFDPVTDARWPDFLASHPQASVFHSPAWLRSLQSTYGYRPVGFTTSSGTSLSDGVVFCEVSSWLTGKRLVSLPFSDHCQPLMTGQEMETLLQFLLQEKSARRYRYVEFRPLFDACFAARQDSFSCSESFQFHNIDLRPDATVLYRRLHESCIRRKIKRAERESLTYEQGNSQGLLEKFGRLMLLTRRRHKLPPQPAVWFENLVRNFGDCIQFHVLSQGNVPVASIVTLRFKQTLVYKYGCSDARFHSLGGTPWLFWRVMEQGKRSGVEEFDLGRSSLEDPGLATFKQHLGGEASTLHYYRNPEARVKRPAKEGKSLVRNLIARLPDPLLAGTGQLLYRHLG